MDKISIMSKAWSLYREIVAEFPESRSRAQFAECLRAVWEQANAARTARREWDGMSGEAQYEALTRMAWTVKRRAEATGRGIDTEWIVTADDAQTVAADAWLRVSAALDRNDERDDPRPLGYILYAACTQAAHSISRSEIRHVSATVSADAIAAANPDTNNGQSLLDIRSSCTAAPISADPADAYTIRVAIEQAAADDEKTRELIAQLAAGYTVREIADQLGMSKSAVQRRIDKVRAAILEQMQA